MTVHEAAQDWDLSQLTDRARRLIAPGHRHLLGIAGPPGAGKSTLATAVAAGLPSGSVAVIPQDGFHLADPILQGRGLSRRKGAPETFDVEGFWCLLARVHDHPQSMIYAPEFYREFEAAVAGSIPIPPGTPLVVVEGNYLLLDVDPWRRIRSLFDETWFLQVPDAIRVSRLIHRHEMHGRSPEEAQTWVFANDEQNAALVRESVSRADVVLRSEDRRRPE